jgi:hypothetical protein
VYLTDETRFIAEHLLQTAKAGGMVWGSRQDHHPPLRGRPDGAKVRVVAPRCIDKTRLTTSLICDAIIRDCSAETPKRTRRRGRWRLP